VGDATGEAADGFHFLRLAELIFEHPALGDVFGDGFQNVGRLIFGSDGAAADADDDGVAIFALPAGFEAVHTPGVAKFFYQARVFLRIKENILPRIERQHFEGRVVTEHSDQRRVDIEKLTFEAGAIHSIHGCLHQRAVANL
jgi:hypothetical protein